MSASPASLSVWVGDNVVWVRIVGRATFHCSVDFKTLINGLWDRGFRNFVLDLTDCILMDSTFLGVLAGFGLKLGPGSDHNQGSVLELLNPNGRISDLLENLGVSHLFRINKAPSLPIDRLNTVPQPSCQPDRKELSRVCLDAHKTLMSLNPANVPKFTDVARFLAEDLQRMEEPNKQ